jgi:hypothetical protein
MTTHTGAMTHHLDRNRKDSQRGGQKATKASMRNTPVG